MTTRMNPLTPISPASHPHAPSSAQYPLPSDPRFRNLDSLIIKLDVERRCVPRAVHRMRKRWIERAMPQTCHVTSYGHKGK